MENYHSNIHIRIKPDSFNQIFNYIKKHHILTNANCPNLDDMTRHSFCNSQLYRYLNKHGLKADFAHEYWYKYGDFNFIYDRSYYKLKDGVPSLVASSDANHIIKQAKHSNVLQNIIKHNVLVSTDESTNLNSIVDIGLKKSLREHRNVILVESPMSFIGASPDFQPHIKSILHNALNISKSTLNKYYIRYDKVLKTCNLTARHITNINRYPKFLLSRQPFLLIMQDDIRDINALSNDYLDWNDYFVFLINQIMQHLYYFPHANKNGLDIIFYNLLHVPHIPKLAKFMRDAPMTNCRFLMGADHRLQSIYQSDCGYDGFIVNGHPFYLDNADLTIFKYSINLPLKISNAKYEHKKLPRLSDFW